MDAAYDRELGLNLRRLRKLQGFTQEQLAAPLQVHGCDITRSALAKIEAGQRHVYPDELRWLKRLLDVEYDALFPE